MVLKDRATEDLLEAIDTVRRGDAWLSPGLTARVLQTIRRRGSAPPDSDAERIRSLTSGELEIIPLVAQGLRNKEIGARLFISEATVRHHLTSIFANLSPSIIQSQSRRVGTHWAIVLAGGEGTRLQPFVTRWLGRDIPKQFRAFSGQRTMLDHTLDRATAIVRPEHVVTILGSGHERFLSRDLPGHVLVQPSSRGTGAAIHLGLSYIGSTDPDAKLLISLPILPILSPE